MNGAEWKAEGDASNLILESAGAGRLRARRGGEDTFTVVRAVKCFPLSEPYRFFSLRNDANEEFAFVEDCESLNNHSAKAMLSALEAGSFSFRVTGIREIEEDFELRVWKVVTAAGERQFQTALDSWPRGLEDGSFIVEDIFGDIYRFPPLAQLDKTSAKRLWSMVG